MKLHGVPLSNYYNIVKHALLEKGLPFEEVLTRPSQDADFLARSPMGKVPLLETEHGFLTETDVILTYLEEACGGMRLFPDAAFARAKVRQLMKTQELYVENPAHDLVGVIFGREVPQHVRDASRINAAKGLAALARLVNFRPWICGDAFTAADIFVFWSFTLSNRLTQQVYQWDMLQDVAGLANWYERMAARDITGNILAEQKVVVDALAARTASR